MKNLIFPVILLLSALLSGCTSIKYQGLAGSEFSDSAPDNRELAFQVNLDNVKYIPTFQHHTFKTHFKEALLSAGFSNAADTKSTSGYSVEATLHHDRSTNWGDFFLYFLTLTIYPASGDNIISFDVNYYKDGEILRSATYQGNYVDYVSAYFPTPLFMGYSNNDFMRLLANDLADNIAKDCPSDNGFSYNVHNLNPMMVE